MSNNVGEGVIYCDPDKLHSGANNLRDIMAKCHDSFNGIEYPLRDAGLCLDESPCDTHGYDSPGTTFSGLCNELSTCYDQSADLMVDIDSLWNAMNTVADNYINADASSDGFGSTSEKEAKINATINTANSLFGLGLSTTANYTIYTSPSNFTPTQLSQLQQSITNLTNSAVANSAGSTVTNPNTTPASTTGAPLTAFALASWFTGSVSAANEVGNYDAQAQNMGDYYAKNYFNEYTPEQARQLGVDEANVAYLTKKYSGATSEDEAKEIQKKLENAQSKFASDKEKMLDKNLTDEGINDATKRQEVMDAKHEAEVVANDKNSTTEQINAAQQKAADLENKYKSSATTTTTKQTSSSSTGSSSSSSSSSSTGSSVQARQTSSSSSSSTATTTTTSAPTTSTPTTSAPTTVPVTSAPTTVPVTSAPTTVPVTSAPTTVPVTSTPTTVPVTSTPVTSAPVTSAPVTSAPVTAVPTTPRTSPTIHDNSGQTLTSPITGANTTTVPTTVTPTTTATVKIPTASASTTKTTTHISNNITSNKSNSGSNVIPIVLGIGAAGAAAIAGTRYIKKKDQEEMYEDDTTNENDFSNLGNYDNKIDTTKVNKGSANDLTLDTAEDVKINNDLPITSNKEELE
jgi:hypothetical protein